MNMETIKQINGLIEELKVNDKKEALEYERPPKEPKETMKELVRIGRPATEPLLELLKNASKYSCLYAIKVLGEIGDSSAVQPIIDAFSSEGYLNAFSELEEDEFAQPAFALHRIGLPALDPTLAFLKEKIEQDDDRCIWHATQILAGIKDEKSFAALVNLLSHQSVDVRIAAIEALSEYGDKRAAEQLKNVLGDDEVKVWALEALRKLVSTQEYRAILEPYVLKHLESFSQEIKGNLSELESAHRYPEKFEGDDAEEFNSIAQEHKIHASIEKLLRQSIELGVYEAVIPDALKDDLNRKIGKILREWYRFRHKHEEEISIITGRFPEDVKSEMTKSYKGLANAGWDSQPKLDELLKRIWEWLKEQGFLVTKELSRLLWARKGTQEKRKGCFIAVTKDDKRGRTWGIIHLALWGKGWTPQEIETFRTSFWNFTERSIAAMVEKRKLQIQIGEN